MMVDRISNTPNGKHRDNPHQQQNRRVVVVATTTIPSDDHDGNSLSGVAAATNKKAPSTKGVGANSGRRRPSASPLRKTGGGGSGNEKEDDNVKTGDSSRARMPREGADNVVPTKRRDSDKNNSSGTALGAAVPTGPPSPPKSPRSSHKKSSSSRRRSGSPVPVHRKSGATTTLSPPQSPASPRRHRPSGREPKSPRQLPRPPTSPGNHHPRKSSKGGGRTASESLSPSRPRRTRSHPREGTDEGEEEAHDGPHAPTSGIAPPPPPPLSPPSATQRNATTSSNPKARSRSSHDKSKTRNDSTARRTIPSPSPPIMTSTALKNNAVVVQAGDMVDIVAQEPPDYEGFYSSPRRRTTSTTGPAPPSPRAGRIAPTTAVGTSSEPPRGTDASGEVDPAPESPAVAPHKPHPSKASMGEAVAAPTATQPARGLPKGSHPHRAEAAVNDKEARPAAAAAAAAPPPTTTARVTSTRSRLQGVMGTLQWVIYIDTPGGHAETRLQLVPAVEVWDEDDEEEKGVFVENTQSAQHPQPVAAVTKAPPSVSAAWCENSLNPTGDDDDHDDDSSLDTQKLHESVLNFMHKLEKTRPGPVAEGFDDSIIDYAHSSHHTSTSQPPPRDASRPLQASGHTQHSTLPPSIHSSSHRGAPSDQRPSQPQRHVSHVNMWSSNRIVEPQVQAPPPPPTSKPPQHPRVPSNGSLPPESVSTSSSSRLLSQYEQQQQASLHAHQLVLTPSDHFVPRVMNIQGMVLLNDTLYRVERENSKDSRTFADTLGDDTIENSCEMPDMWQIDEFEKSQTWGQTNDFSASDAEDDDEETLDNPFSPCGKSVDTNVVEDYDDDDDDVSEYQKNRAAGYLTNYGYAGTPGSAMVTKGSLTRGSNTQSADEGSIDPSKGFLPRGSKASMFTDASDSLADIQDSFACDSGVEEFQHSQLTEKRRNQINSGLGQDSKNYGSMTQSMYSQSLSSLPEDRVLNDGPDATGNGAYSSNATGGMRRTIGILGGGASPSMRRSPESQLPPPLSLGARKDVASRLSATQHQPAQRPMALRQRTQATSKQSPSPSSTSNSDAPVPKLASQFADSFLGPSNCPSSTLKNAGFTTCSENDAQALHSAKLALQRSMNSLSTGSDSSTSMHSFGIPGLRTTHQTDAKAFVQFNLTAAYGVKVIHNENDVNSGRNNRTLPKMSLTAKSPMSNRSEHDQSIDEFNVNSMPPLVDMEAPAPESSVVRRLPGRGLSLLGNRRVITKKPESSNAESTTAFKTPKASNRRFLRREKSSNVPREDSALASRSSHHDIVKRFFTLANSSFGSLGPPSEFLDDDETNNDDDIRY